MRGVGYANAWVLLAILVGTLFLADSGIFSQQAVSIQEGEGGKLDFGRAAVDWWNARSTFEQNIIIYGVMGLALIGVFAGVTRGS